MKLVSIKERTVTIELASEDCVRLAEACNAGAEGVRDGNHYDEVQTLGALFEAAALAALADSYMHGENVLTLDNLRRGAIGVPVWGDSAAAD